MQKNTIIKVLNRDNGQTIYSIPEMNGLRRVYEAGETKEVTFEELQKLTYIPGGMALLKNNLMIQNKMAVKELLGEVEPEYLYTESEIKTLMLSGSLDEFLDCLDFAPGGVLQLIKTLAVEMPLNDVRKRQAIFEKTGFNVDNAIKIKQQSEEPQGNVSTTPQRRVQKSKVQVDSPVPARRVVRREN